jgi:RNA polymerase-associated protein
MTEEVCDTTYEAVNWGFGELLWFRRSKGALAETLRAAASNLTQSVSRWASLTSRLACAEYC